MLEQLAGHQAAVTLQFSVHAALCLLGSPLLDCFTDYLMIPASK